MTVVANGISLMGRGGMQTLPAPRCLLCGVQGRILYDALRDQLFEAPGIWSLRRCLKCGLVWLDPRPALEGIGELYRKYYTHGTEARSRSAFSKKLRESIIAAMRTFSMMNSRPCRMS